MRNILFLTKRLQFHDIISISYGLCSLLVLPTFPFAFLCCPLVQYAEHKSFELNNIHEYKNRRRGKQDVKQKYWSTSHMNKLHHFYICWKINGIVFTVSENRHLGISIAKHSRKACWNFEIERICYWIPWLRTGDLKSLNWLNLDKDVLIETHNDWRSIPVWLWCTVYSLTHNLLHQILHSVQSSVLSSGGNRVHNE